MEKWLCLFSQWPLKNSSSAMCCYVTRVKGSLNHLVNANANSLFFLYSFFHFFFSIHSSLSPSLSPTHTLHRISLDYLESFK